MFQPMPTPFTSFQTSYGVANANIPHYTFAPTPLGHDGGGSDAGCLGLGAASVYASPIFQTLPDNSAHHLPYSSVSPHHDHRSHRHRHARSIKMEQQSDLAQQEAAARDYKPQLEGPLVGEKTTSHAITEEYAKADPTFVAKTMALPQTYSHYRPIQGDGNCGWRAIGFGYFESLIRCGDIDKLQAESERLTALNTFLDKVGGYSPYIFEDFTEVTLEVMTEIMQALTNGQDAMPILLARFNDEALSAPMVYHLRLLAASWLKGNFAQYEHYIPGDANTYCEDWILPVNREIDQVEIMLLFNVLLKPANIVLEIAYLDRSEGDAVNVHRMPDEAKDQEPANLGPTIVLLYRPGHYDILYRDAIGPPIREPPTAPTSLHVNRVASFTHQHEIQSSVPSLQNFATLDMSPLAMIPGFDPGLSPLSPPPASSPHTEGYSPPPSSAWMYSDGLPPVHQHVATHPSPPNHPMDSSLGRVRFSKYNYRGMADMGAFSPEPAFMTNTFRQSHYNIAHYNNPHFQPEEYRPDYDEEIPTSRMGGRKRST
ncbi:peptidase C65 Otubain-domain-containing protein [Xylariales sp. AK1849]|nr:peptidase C65 Otubain-domain-containing protein [Xylariales sp. AK1849]